MRRAYHRILGMPQIRPEGLCFRATLKSGRATANPITWPFRSAKQTRSGTTIGLSCFARWRSEEHTSELQSRSDLVCRLLLEKKKKMITLSCCYCEDYT